MGIFSMIADFVTGGAASAAVEAVKTWFPPGMSEAERAQLELAVRQAERQREIELLRLAGEAEAEFNRRLRDLEGTAADLRGVRLLGPLVIFLRGCQRPAWGFAAMWADFMVFSGAWDVDLSAAQGGWTPQGLALVVVNVLVLGFLFGERALQNVLPLAGRIIEARSGR